MVPDDWRISVDEMLSDHSCLGRPSDDDFASMVKLLLFRRDVCCRSTVCKRVVADTVVVSQEMPRSATPYTSLIAFRPQSNSDWLCDGVKSLFYYTLVITDFHQFKSYLVLFCFVLSGRLGWRHGLIWPLIGWPYQCEMRFSRDEINNYYSIYTMTTSPYLYITTMYSYWRTSPCLNKLYNIQLQYFWAKFFPRFTRWKWQNAWSMWLPEW